MKRLTHGVRMLRSALLILFIVAAGSVSLARAQSIGGEIDSVNKFARPGNAQTGDTVGVNISINTLPCVPPYSASVALVIDKSGSMSGAPLKNALEAATLFVDTLDLSRDQASVVAFSGDGADKNSANDAQTILGLSQNRNDLINGINSIKVDQNTNIYEGLRQGGATLTKAPADNAHALVLLTDGLANIDKNGTSSSSGASDALALATTLKGQGIRIYTIGLGKVDDNFLRNVATSPAQYYPSPTPADLPEIYSRIARTLLADIGTNANVVESYDSSNFEIISGSQIPSSGVVNTISGTITWSIPTLSSRQSFSYQVRALSAPGTYDVSQKTTISYKQATGCAKEGQVLDFSFGSGASIDIGEQPVNVEPAQVTVSLSADPNQTAAPGDVITYTVTATNRGKGSASEVKITLPFDSQLVELVDAAFSQPSAWVSKVNTNDIEIRTGSLDKGGDSVTGTIRFKVLSNAAAGSKISTQATFHWSDAVSGGDGTSNTVTLTVSDQSTSQQYATLTVTPFSGPAGTTYQIKGSGFTPNEPVSFWYNTPDNKDVAVGKTTANADGDVTITFTSTGLTPGNYAMVGHGQWSGLTAVGIFQVQ